MKTLWDDATCRELLTRIGRLTPDTPPRWGRLQCTQMVVHVTDAFKLYAGDLQCRGKWTPACVPVVKHAFIYLVPIPKNVPTAPELLARTPGSWTDEVARLNRAVASFAQLRTRDDWPPHPIFGRLSRRAYGVLAYKHTDHHLRQFGV